jgi:hypothetical protein
LQMKHAFIYIYILFAKSFLLLKFYKLQIKNFQQWSSNKCCWMHEKNFKKGKIYKYNRN